MKSASRVSTEPFWSTSALVSVYGASGRPTADVTTISASLPSTLPSLSTSPNVPAAVQKEADTAFTAIGANVVAAVSWGVAIAAGEEPEATSISNVRFARVTTPPAPAGFAPANTTVPLAAFAVFTVGVPKA